MTNFEKNMEELGKKVPSIKKRIYKFGWFLLFMVLSLVFMLYFGF